jgi:acetyl-CoA synthetase
LGQQEGIVVDSSLEPATDDLTTAGLEIAWRPTRAYIERSRLRRFMTTHGLSSFEALLKRSTTDLAWFWQAACQDLELEWYREPDAILDLTDGIAWPRWFPGGKLNYVHNALDKHARGALRDKVALIWEGEDGEVRRLTYGEVYAETNRLANVLRGLGVGKGDRVAIFMPMVPEVAIASFACSKIGAIYIPLFSGYAVGAVSSRLQDSGARVLITADGFYRRGQVVRMKEVADEAVAQSPEIEKVIVFRRVGREVGWNENRDLWWDQVVPLASAECETEQTDADDPCLLIYTSGTTGRPKGTVHVHAGFPLKCAQDMAHCFDVQSDDTVFWFTDMGWMMGPWLFCGALTLGTTALCYEGTPDYPGPDRVWQIVARHQVTVLGISPTAIRGLMRFGDEPLGRHDLSSLRVLGSTGEPWNPEPWRWFFEKVGGGRCPIINYSGGTEIAGGIIGCFTILPLKPCCFSGPVPGMAADVVDEVGNPVRGEVGELVIRQPWPGMTRGFWQDPDRYIETYWSRLPGTWVHGDWAYVDDEGFWFIQGRSDDTIKIAGKRLGPAEVESVAVSHPAVSEAAAIGVPHELKGEGLVVFAILRPEYQPAEMLRDEITELIVQQLGKPLRPEAVKFVLDLPKTRNAKIMRRIIRARYLGRELGDVTSLENPAAVEEIARAH